LNYRTLAKKNFDEFSRAGLRPLKWDYWTAEGAQGSVAFTL